MAFTYDPHNWEPNELIKEAELDHIEQGIAQIANNLKTVAETGSYNDLENKPTINGHELTGALDTDSLDLRYTLPIASAEELGGVKIGTRLNITEDGVLNVQDGGKADSVDWSNVEGRPENLGDFNNDQNFTTKAQVQNMINESGGSSGEGGGNFKVEVVQSIPQPQQMDASTIYMVPRSISELNDKYEEYVLVNDDEVERIGGGASSGSVIAANALKFIIHANQLSWEPEGNLFKSTINVESLTDLETNSFVLDVLQSDSEELNEIVRENWNSVIRVTVSNQVLTLYSIKEFDVLDMQLLVFTTKNDEGGNTGTSIADAVVELDQETIPYDGQSHLPSIVSVTLKDQQLQETQDYVISGVASSEIGPHAIIIFGVGQYAGRIIKTWTIEKGNGSISVAPNDIVVRGNVGDSTTAKLTVVGDGEITISESQYVNIVNDKNTLTISIKDYGSDTITITLADGEKYKGSNCTLKVKCAANKIYGVKWDNIASSKLTRTDDAALFDDPVAADKEMKNVTPEIQGSSPFDNLDPWNQMKVVEKDGNSLVAIPKFWYQITNNDGKGFALRIANYAAPGFSVSPAHMDRNDGVGERDWVYVGRFMCVKDTYKSCEYGDKWSELLDTARSTLNSTFGAGYYVFDFALLRTIQMLYLVEFADWNSQKTIAKAEGNDSSGKEINIDPSEVSDIKYHTGVGKYVRSDDCLYYYQYRYIGLLWSYETFVDGLDGQGDYQLALEINPTKYNATGSNYTIIGKPADTSGNGQFVIKSWEIPTENSWAFYPKEVIQKTNYDTYICDTFSCYWAYSDGGIVCFGDTGGGYDYEEGGIGLFNYMVLSERYSHSVRLQYLPQSANEEIT